jgi:lipopolysaccharide export system permease protein
MKKLHLLTIKSFIGPLILTFFIAEFVLIMQFLFLYIEDLVGKGLEFSVVLKFLLYSSANLVKMALPLSILLASIMTFGNLGENYELSAIKSAGVSLQRVMLPLVAFCLILGAFLFYFSNNVLPGVNLRMRALYYDISNKQPEMLIKEGVFNDGVSDFRIKVESKSNKNNMMYGFMVYDHKEKRGNPKVTLADSGTIELTTDMKFLVITLHHGKTYEEVKEPENKKVRPEHHTFFSKQIVSLPLTDTSFIETPIHLFGNDYHTKNIAQLLRAEDSIKASISVSRNKFIKRLNQRHLKYENKKKKQLEIANKSHITNLDSFFIASKSVDQTAILKSAKKFAESNKKSISLAAEQILSNQKNLYRHSIALHEKFTFPFACVIFFLIGAPLGAIIRKGGFGLPILVSILFFLFYYVITIIGKKLAEEGFFSPWFGMWLSSFMTLPLGLFFTYKATTDSSLLDLGIYTKYIIRTKELLMRKIITFKDTLQAQKTS